jgi:hypothetical protein
MRNVVIWGLWMERKEEYANAQTFANGGEHVEMSSGDAGERGVPTSLLHKGLHDTSFGGGAGTSHAITDIFLIDIINNTMPIG